MIATADVGDRFSAARLAEAHAASAATVRRTPIVTAASLSAQCGGDIVLKAENLQRTGSFKLRGALNKVRCLGGRCTGVVAGSAGNHAQSLAFAARAGGLSCEIYMPVQAPVSKLAAVRAFGATVHQDAASVDECVTMARTRAKESSSLAFVHPFDDEDIVVGQAGIGLELADDVEELRTVVVPIGGGGLVAGVAMALRQRLRQVTVIGVQAAACAPVWASVHGHATPTGAPATIADGIAIKRPGGLTLPLVQRYVDGVVTVDEEAIADAMTLLLEGAKLLVEGAGAVAAAALVTGAVRPAKHGRTVALLSGGNVDLGLVAAIASRQETKAGRRIRVRTSVSDRPGGLVELLGLVAACGVNVLSVEHLRDAIPHRVRQTSVDLTLETRGPEHTQQLLEHLRSHGYDPGRDK